MLIILSLFVSTPSPAETKHLVFASIIITNISEPKTDYNSGLAIELLNRMSNKLNFTYEVEFYPLSRAVDLIARGRADSLIGVYYSDRRAEIMDYGSVPIYQDEIRLFSKPNHNFQWDGDHKQLHNKRIALIRSGFYGSFIEKYKHTMQVIEVNSMSQQFKLLEKGRIDVSANNIRTVPVVMSRLQLEDKFISHLPALNIMPGYFAFSKRSKNKNMLKKIDQYMLELAKTGELKTLQQRFNPQIH